MKAKELKEMLENCLAQNKADLAEHELLKKHLADFDGRPFNKYMEKKLPAGWKINIRNSSVSVDTLTEERKHYIGHTNSGGLNLAKLNETNSPNGIGAKERINKCEYWLEIRNFQELLNAYNKLEKAYKLMYTAVKEIDGNKFGSFEVPVFYDVLRLIGFKSSLFSDIVYDK